MATIRTRVRAKFRKLRDTCWRLSMNERLTSNDLRGPPRARNPWQFSLFSLLVLMTSVAVGSALLRTYPRLSIGLFIEAGLIAILLVADQFTHRATRKDWSALVFAAWVAVGVFFAVFVGIVVFYAVLFMG